MGSLEYYAMVKDNLEANYGYIEDYICGKMLKLRGAKYKKSLAKDDRKYLDNIVWAVFSNIPDEDFICSDEFIDNNLQDISIKPMVNLFANGLGDADNAKAFRERCVMALSSYFYYRED